MYIDLDALLCLVWLLATLYVVDDWIFNRDDPDYYEKLREYNEKRERKQRIKEWIALEKELKRRKK